VREEVGPVGNGPPCLPTGGYQLFLVWFDVVGSSAATGAGASSRRLHLDRMRLTQNRLWLAPNPIATEHAMSASHATSTRSQTLTSGIWWPWVITFIAFPPAGLLGRAAAGPVNDLLAAALAGVVAGGV